jgi:deoxyribose-phosphate aldolase
MTILPTLQAALDRGRALKIISGLNNFDFDRVAAVVRAADRGGATFVDIAADADLVRMVKELISLPVCVSAVEPEKFVAAVAAGADLIEIGNFDSFYAQGRRFEAEEVLALTRATRALLPSITLSVTVPHILPLDQQVQLAEELVQAGADLIQTEGGTSSSPAHPGALGLMEKAAPTLAAAYEISRAVSVPVLCASGLSSVTAPLAIAAGASGVGVGSAINQLNSELAMVAAVRSLVESLATVSRTPVLA